MFTFPPQPYRPSSDNPGTGADSKMADDAKVSVDLPAEAVATAAVQPEAVSAEGVEVSFPSRLGPRRDNIHRGISSVATVLALIAAIASVIAAASSIHG